MRRTRGDRGEGKNFGQTARRYVESEVLSQRREMTRLRTALEEIESAEPPANDIPALEKHIDSLRSLARRALAPPRSSGD